MTPLQRHVLLPGLVPLLFMAVAATPVEIIGCRNRGMLALVVALVSVIAGLYAAARAGNLRRHGDPHGQWWLVTTLLFAIAPVALLLLA